VGTPVTIWGINFGSTQGTVSFGGVQANVSGWGATQVQTVVPAGFASATVAVTAAGGSTAVSQQPFVVNAGISVSPTSGYVGDWVTVTCVAFACAPGATTVTFNGVAAAAMQNWTASSFQVQVPDTTSGDVVVTGSASGQVTFTVTPKVTGLSIGQGPAQMGFVITGTGFGAAQGGSAVTLGGTVLAVAPNGWTSTAITVQIPAGTANGNNLQVLVKVGGVPSANPNNVSFSVVCPFGCCANPPCNCN
jgi:hypothetical protein